MFVVMNHRVSQKKIQEMYPGAIIIDVTSHGPEPWIRFSPFYPHGNIPIAFSPGWVSASVEGIWKGLKVFERADIDIHNFTITTSDFERTWNNPPGSGPFKQMIAKDIVRIND